MALPHPGRPHRSDERQMWQESVDVLPDILCDLLDTVELQSLEGFDRFEEIREVGVRCVLDVLRI